MPDSIDPAARQVASSTDLEPPLTECPPWCRFRYPDHSWTGTTPAGDHCREHSIDVGAVDARTHTLDRLKPGSAWVGIDALEVATAAGSTYEEPAVVLSAEFCRFTVDEARDVAWLLLEAAFHLKNIQQQR